MAGQPRLAAPETRQLTERKLKASLSVMETHEPAGAPRQPTPEEAKAALHQADQARAAMTDIRTPLWFFLVLGVWIAPIGPAISLLPDPPAGVVLLVGGLVVWVAVLVTMMQLVVKQMRVLAWLSDRQMRPFGAIMLPLLGAYVVLQTLLHPSWGPAAITVVIGAGIVAFGLYHQRQARTRPS